MTPQEFALHWDALMGEDPDVVVDIVGITTEELLDAYADKAEAYIEKEFG